MKTLFSSFFVLSLVSIASAATPFRVEDMHKLARISGVQLSPDGKWAAFTVTRSDVAKNQMVTNIWLVSTEGGTPQQLTFTVSGSNNSPRWSPDSRYLYFISNRTDNIPQIFRLQLAGGEARQITSIKTGVNAFYISPDGKTIALVSTVYPDCSDIACNEKRLKEKEDNPVKAQIISSLPFRRWDSWVEGRRKHIFVMSSDGGDARDITPGDSDSPRWTESGSDEVAFSPDSREICFSRYSENESLTGNSDLYTVPVTGGTPRQITTNKASDFTPLYSPDGRYIAYTATLRPMLESDISRLFLYDRKTGERKNLTETLDRSVDSFHWAPDSRSLYLTFEDRGQVPIVRLDLAAQSTATLVADGTSGDVQISRDGSFLVYTNMDFSHPADIYKANLAENSKQQVTAKRTQLTNINSDLIKEIQFGEYSSFEFPGWNSEKVQAWAVKPPGFDPGKKYPLLLLMHGGPENAWDNLFHYRWNVQLFAAAGYVVIMPNFHGSSGFGLKFQDAIKGQWGSAPYEDQMKAVDTALTWPFVDATRLAAAGASYGGYMANWLEGHTERFRTIVSHAGIYDLFTSLYASDLIGGLETELRGTPWENPRALIEQAPVTYAKNFKTPMLVVHGGLDYRVELAQGLAMFQILQAMHVPSKLLYFPNENHWVLKPADSVLWYHTVLDWLNQWVSPDKEEYRKMLQR